MTKKITEATIEALSRNFFKEAAIYGFKYEHYLRFVNVLLDQALTQTGIVTPKEDKTNFLDEIPLNELPIKTNEMVIRKFNKQEDSAELMKWLEDDYGKYFLHSFTTYTVDQLVSGVNNELGIILDEKDNKIGLVAFLNIDKKLGKGELRKLIGDPELRGKGLGKKATKLWMNYGKNCLQLRKIYLYTVDTNIRNIKLNEELGFKVEGILREEIKINNEFYDVLRMSIIL